MNLYQETDSYAPTLIITVVLLLGILLAVIGTILRQPAEPVEQRVQELIEQQCELVVKTNEIHSGVAFGEDQAGTYHYNLYVTSDGMVEVWKCQK